MMLELIEPDIKFIFNKDSVVKYDELNSHKNCGHFSKKGVDFIYKFGSKLILIEVKDFNRKNSNSFIQQRIEKSIKKKLEINKQTPFEIFINDIIQKFNDTLLDLYSSLIKNIDELKLFTKRIKEIIFILVLELPDTFKFYKQVIQDKIEQEIKKLNCIFNANLLLIDSSIKLQSFKMEKL
jgi:hypothetical protein